MNQIPPITDAELEIMRVLWANPDCPSSEVVKKMTDLMGWSPNTTRTLLSRLVQKEARVRNWKRVQSAPNYFIRSSASRSICSPKPNPS